MLEEKAGYLKDFPMNIRITHIENYPLHYHNDPEFICILKGFVTLKCGSSTYNMQQGDIFVVNESEVHGIYNCSQDNIVMMIQIETRYYEKFFPMLKYSVYRTLSKDRNDENLIHLKLQLLQVAFNYLKRSPGYKMEDTDLMVEIIQLMDKYFASFYFDGQTVMQKKFEKPEQTERLGRIINYIYKHHYENITLKDLAEMEYLSEYYISHMITAGTGLNFRELLAFARVEESEKLLLQSDEKISAIAKRIGFSTTAYYKKFFKKWYMCEPDEYRKTYSNHIKGFDIEKTTELERHEAIDLVSDSISFLTFEIDEQVGRKFHYNDIEVDFGIDSIGKLDKEIVLGGSIETSHFNIYGSKQLLGILGTEIREKPERIHPGRGNYIWDTIATIPHIAKIYASDEYEKVDINNYMDTGSGTAILNGERGIMTSQQVPKPSFYAYRMLNAMKGEIIAKGDYFIATRNRHLNESAGSQFSILVYNTCPNIEALFEGESGMRVTQRTICDFVDSRAIRIVVDGLETGMYQKVEIRQVHKNSLFSLAYMDNSSRHELSDEEALLLDEASMPDTKISSMFLRGEVSFRVNLKGLAYHVIRLQRK